jgi:hypothetical protein
VVSQCPSGMGIRKGLGIRPSIGSDTVEILDTALVVLLSAVGYHS